MAKKSSANPSIELHRAIFDAERTIRNFKTVSDFDPSNNSHIDLIVQCIEQLNNTRNYLLNIDNAILLSFSTAIAATSLYFLPIAPGVAGISLLAGGICVGLRQNAAGNYQQALDNLIACCEWTLNTEKPEFQTRAVPERMQSDHIKRMLETLAPLTTDTQLQALTLAQYHDFVLTKAAPARTRINGQPVDTTYQQMIYNIYGHEQGGFYATLKAIYFGLACAYSNLAKLMSSIKAPAVVKTQGAEPCAAAGPRM
jgi:hypothetical protein